MKRQLTEKEKEEVRKQQVDTDGTLKCLFRVKFSEKMI